jgi:cob(I)alamin adenosyltransferase
MKNLDNFNKVRSKMFEIIFQLSQIDQISKTFVTEIEQEQINNMVEIIKAYQHNNELLQNFLFDYLHELTENTEDSEFNAEETEEGYKI